jgi:predicted Rossmann-fold nucleotide-binding protein
MKFKIGIFGSAIEADQPVAAIIEKLSAALCKEDVILITGGSFGIPYAVASTCAKAGTEVWGYTPARNLEEQEKFAPGTDSAIYKKLVFTPQEFDYPEKVRMKYRNVLTTAECDGAIVIAGRWGSMNEFTNLFDMGKVIGVLTGTGGVADELPGLMKKISKKSQAVVLFNNSPEELVTQVINELSTKA